MKCQLKYRWVKLPRACLPQGKGVLGQWVVSTFFRKFSLQSLV